MNSLKISKEKRFFFIFALFIKILYDIQLVICLPEFYGTGISYGIDINYAKIVIGWMLFFSFLLLLVPFFDKSFISYSISFLFFIGFMPVVTTFGFCNADWSYILFQTIYWLLIFIGFIVSKNVRLKELLVFKIKNRNAFLFFSLSLVFILVLAFSYKYNHLNISFNLNDVYRIRAESKGRVPTYIAWIKQSFGSITIPFLIIFCAEKKKYNSIILLFVLDILLFSIAMDKAYLFSLLISFTVAFFVLKLKIKIYTFFSAFLFLGFSVSLFEKIERGTIYIFYYLIRRIFYLPSWINTMYYDYFSQNPKLFLSQGVFVFSKVIPKVYDDTYLSIINRQYFNGFVPSPNTGLFAEAYCQLGIWGIFVFPILIILFLLMINSLLRFHSSACKFICAYCLSLCLTNIFLLSGYFVSICFPFMIFVAITNTFYAKRDNLLK